MASATRENCTCRVCNDVQIILNNIIDVLKLYGWLLDASIIDYFHEDLWSKLPESWKIVLINASLNELGSFILGESTCNRVWPLSLIALRKVIGILGINRNPDKKPIFICEAVENRVRDKFDSFIPEDRSIENFEKIFKKHIKEKKRYEIDKFSQICVKCAHLNYNKFVVDAGGGMGHLARALSFKYNLRVISIEENKSLETSAKTRDYEIQKALHDQVKLNRVNHKHINTSLSPSSSLLSDLSEKTPHYVCARLTDENLKDVIEKISEVNLTKITYGLIGLHTCGDLASTLLKLYVKQDADFICVIGCCYMKLTVKQNCDTKLVGYPLSNYISMKFGNTLSYNALEVACHAVEDYCDKLKSDYCNDLRVHAYRATLEMMLIKKGGISMKYSRINSVKVKYDMTFDQYSKLATAKLPDDKKLNSSDMEHPRVLECLSKWRNVVTFEAIRLMLAPLVETAVLLDRFMYLSENGLKPMLKAIFDPRRSPRNIVLYSIKDTRLLY